MSPSTTNLNDLGGGHAPLVVGIVSATMERNWFVSIDLPWKGTMKTIETTRVIAAPIDVVFDAISDVRNFSQAVSHITHIEFLTDQRVGVGTRFRETREMNGRSQTVELEVAEYVENEQIRMISDAGGTVWDTVFTVAPVGDVVEMKMVMEAKPHKFLAKIMNLLIRSMVVKAVEADMDAVKVYCESRP